MIDRLITADQWRVGQLPILIVADAGYDTTRLAHELADLPVELLGPAALGPGLARSPHPVRTSEDRGHMRA